MLSHPIERRAALGQHVADAQPGVHDTWLDAVYAEYIRQCDEDEMMMDKIRRTDGQSVRLFGDPITLPGKVDRYAFWPKHKAQFHVLYYAAVACVCVPAAGMKLERVNSVAGRINSRLRSCMRHKTLSSFVLAQEWLKETIKVVGAPRELIDIAAWRFSLDAGDVSDSDDSDSEGDD